MCWYYLHLQYVCVTQFTSAPHASRLFDILLTSYAYPSSVLDLNLNPHSPIMFLTNRIWGGPCVNQNSCWRLIVGHYHYVYSLQWSPFCYYRHFPIIKAHPHLWPATREQILRSDTSYRAWHLTFTVNSSRFTSKISFCSWDFLRFHFIGSRVASSYELRVADRSFNF